MSFTFLSSTSGLGFVLRNGFGLSQLKLDPNIKLSATRLKSPGFSIFDSGLSTSCWIPCYSKSSVGKISGWTVMANGHLPYRYLTVTSMLVTDIGDQMCWWQVWDDGDRFRMLVTDLIHWENHQHNEKSRQHNDSGTNIWNQSPS